METPPTLAERISTNVRRLRGGHSLAALADASRPFAAWQSGHISHIERGQWSATLAQVSLLQLSLTKLLSRPVALGELLGYDPDYLPDPDTGEVDPDYWGANQVFELATGFAVLPSDFLRYLREDDPAILLHAARQLETLRKRFAPTSQERKLARRAGVSPLELDRLSHQLWSRSFEEERDARAGENASPQRKGRYSVQLLAEIAQATGGGGDRG